LRIPLPKVKKSADAKVHPYPFQIGLQTLEFLQGTIFYVSYQDVAAGEFIRTTGALDRMETVFLERLYTKKTYDEAWGYLKKYQEIFKNAAFSNVLISFCSHWDWYLLQLSKFIEFGSAHVGGCPVLSNNERKEFSRISRASFLRQVELLEKATGCSFGVSQVEREHMHEMTLVRNLGLHNRWEIDEKYLQISKTQGLAIGELRPVGVDELYAWHKDLIHLISQTSKGIAIRYVDAPDYP
jgi:hypothetical protein